MISEDYKSAYQQGYYDAMHNFRTKIDALDKMVKAEISEWIPVSERLPEKSGEFLVTVINNKYRVVVIELAWFAHKNDYDDIEESEWRELELEPDEETVIAWMPLPEPYKEDNK